MRTSFRINLFAAAFLLLSFALPSISCKTVGSTNDNSQKDYVYQVSTLHSLADGNFQGIKAIGELAKYGDTGLGTFDHIDGEMILYRGTFYRADLEGQLNMPDSSVTTPFAAVTSFDPGNSFTVDEATCKEIQHTISELYNQEDTILAIEITGNFSYLRYRSVDRQEEPYPTLGEVIENQNVMQSEYIPGTAVGFYFPDQFGGINTPGYHFHFIDDDLKRGGHVLECEIMSATVSIDSKDGLVITLN